MRRKEFGLVRMGGTIGWILAAWPLYFILVKARRRRCCGSPAYGDIFIPLSGIASLVLASFQPSACLTRRRNLAASGETFRLAGGSQVPEQAFTARALHRHLHRLDDSQWLLPGIAGRLPGSTTVGIKPG